MKVFFEDDINIQQPNVAFSNGKWRCLVCKEILMKEDVLKHFKECKYHTHSNFCVIKGRLNTGHYIHNYTLGKTLFVTSDGDIENPGNCKLSKETLLKDRERVEIFGVEADKLIKHTIDKGVW